MSYTYDDNYIVEVREAIDAADIALRCLNNAKSSLNSARNWGIYDMIGGGLFSTVIKRNKMSDSQRHMNSAKYALRKLEKELRDVDRISNLNLDTSSFLYYADFFFDSFLVDWIVQGQILEAREKIDETISSVEMVRRELSVQLS
ncbi:hypothetical protein SAMN02910369_00523 [Lachnospiraceae bacterium NE2001]|nr:hypothetical protein SAMN02910369_00523 [Lachnospiraceae bacterium NE2001]